MDFEACSDCLFVCLCFKFWPLLVPQCSLGPYGTRPFVIRENFWYNSRIPNTPYSFRVRIKKIRVKIRVRVRVGDRIKISDLG